MQTAITPNKVLHVKDVPPQNTSAYTAFERLFEQQEGYTSIRNYTHYAFVEFKDVGCATAVHKNLNGHKYHAEAPPLRLDYDRDAGNPKPKKRKFEPSHSPYPPSRPRMMDGYPPYGSSHFPPPDPYEFNNRDYYPRLVIGY